VSVKLTLDCGAACGTAVTLLWYRGIDSGIAGRDADLHPHADVSNVSSGALV